MVSMRFAMPFMGCRATGRPGKGYKSHTLMNPRSFVIARLLNNLQLGGVTLGGK